MKLLWELFWTFAKMGAITFGGGMAMLPILQREVVENKRWATEEELTDYYAIGQCTPGIIAVNTATYVGYKQAGFIGGVSGTLGMVSPSLIIICLVASILNNFIHMPVVLHALAGIRIVVCALMLNTVVSMMKKGIIDKLGALVCLAAFILACFTPVPTALMIVLSGVTSIIAKHIEGRRNA